MKSPRTLLDNIVVWTIIEVAAMSTGAIITHALTFVSDGQSIGRSLTPITVLLSVAVAIISQLWVKLNDLSSLKSLGIEERKRLYTQIRARVRALVWLIIFFMAFIFYVLACAAVVSANIFPISGLLDGVGAGYGACIALIAAVLVDLNEVSQFRWSLEVGDDLKLQKAAVLSELSSNGTGFGSDENLKSYNRVVGE